MIVPAREPEPQPRRLLNGLSDVRAFFHNNTVPLYFISPTPFNLLGIYRWIRNFFYLTYYDSFEGEHSRVFVPRRRDRRDFDGMGMCATTCCVIPRHSSSSRTGVPVARPVL